MRYVSTTENIAIEERMLAVIDTDVTIGEDLAKLVVNALLSMDWTCAILSDKVMMVERRKEFRRASKRSS